MPPRRLKSKTRSATPNEKMLAVFGLSPASYVARGLPADAWQTWNRAYGSAWRLQHGCANELDRSRFDRGVVELESIVPDPPGLRGRGAHENSSDRPAKPAPSVLLSTGLGDSAQTVEKNEVSNG